MFKDRELKRIIGIVLLLCIGLSNPVLSQKTGYKIDNGKKKVHIPIEIYNNLIVVPVVLNNRIPLNFIVDTGVRSAIITDRIITDMLDLPYNRKITIKGPGDYSVLEAYVVTEVELTMEGVHGYRQAMLVLKEDYLQLRNYIGIEVHGIIGWDIFTRFVVELDYVNKIMILHEPRSFKPKKKYTAFPITIEDTKPYLMTEIQISDSTALPAKLMVDTGASHAIMLNQNEKNGFYLPNKNLEVDLGRGLGGKITGKIARIHQLQIGEFRFNNLLASFPDPDSYPDTISFIKRNGTLGGEILSRFTVIFDYRHKMFYLKKNSGYKRGFEFNMSGLTISARGDDLTDFAVELVRADSPADRVDIRKGDIIKSINGYIDINISLNEIYQFFNSKEGRKIRIEIFRDGEILRKNFRLERLL